MTTFLILAPYGVFAMSMLVTSPAMSLFASAATCLAVIAFDIARGHQVKLLGAGTALTFAALGCYQILGDPPLSKLAIRIAVDSALLLIGLLSLALRKPFTLQYAREMVDAEAARSPEFVTANYVITSVWVAAFLLMIVANWLLLNWPDLPLWSGFVIVLAIRNPALYFSKWYPGYVRRKHDLSPALAAEAR
jgi:hypothetical protein